MILVTLGIARAGDGMPQSLWRKELSLLPLGSLVIGQDNLALVLNVWVLVAIVAIAAVVVLLS